VEGRRQGQGRHQYASGDIYCGEWCQDQRQGRGALYLASGDIFVGAHAAAAPLGALARWHSSTRRPAGQIRSVAVVCSEGMQERRGRRGAAWLGRGACLSVRDVPALQVGPFLRDQQQGLGCMYLVAQGRKMVGEWLQVREHPGLGQPAAARRRRQPAGLHRILAPF
jgi:hypothetical protein